jgi:flagellar biogenesis protein FliO
MQKNSLIIILGIIIFILLLFRICTNGSTDSTTTSDTIKIIKYRDTIVYKESIKYIPVIDTFIIVDSIPADIDSFAIVQDYFNKYVYKDTREDSSCSISIIDSVSQNKIFSRTLDIECKAKIKTETNIVTNTIIKKNKFRLGIGFSTDFNTFTPGIIGVVKNHTIIVGYNIPSTSSSNSITIGYSYLFLNH